MTPSQRLRSTLLLSLPLISWACGPEAQEGIRTHEPSEHLQRSYLRQSPPGLTPELFAPGVVSTEGREGGVVVYPGGEELYFWVVQGPREAIRTSIFVMKEENGEWTDPELLPFSGSYVDGYIALHPDGSRMYFQSNRRVPEAESAFEWNLWVVEREGDGWGEPRSMGRPINGKNHTSGPSVTADGTLYFTIMELGGVSELYRSAFLDGVYQDPERLPDEVNAFDQQYDSYVAPDESYLIFNALEEGNPHNGGLHISFRNQGGSWKAAQWMGSSINVTGEMGSATITPDGRYVFYARWNHENETDLDIFWFSSDALDAWR